MRNCFFCSFFCSSFEINKMVEKWTLCIDVSCYPNPGQAIIEYVLHNKATNESFQRKREICGRSTNNIAYYIVLIEGLKTTKMYSSNDICVYTNSLLLCNQMKGIYQVRKRNLMPLHVEARTISVEFHSVTINHQSNINRMFVDLLSSEMSIPGGV